jgi:hypothetical protein
MPVKTKILPEGRTKAFFMGSCTTVTVQSYAEKIPVRTILWIRDNNSGSGSSFKVIQDPERQQDFKESQSFSRIYVLMFSKSIRQLLSIE